MKNVSTTIYTIDELSEDARQKAIDNWRQNDDMPFLEDAMTEQLHYLLEKHGIKPIDVEVRYSLSYCQGDGASFTGEIEWGAWRATVSTNSWGNHYAHWNTVNVTEMTSLKTDKDAPAASYKKLDEIVHDIGRELEDAGYAEIEYQHEDETVIEHLRANDYEFHANGDVYYER